MERTVLTKKTAENHCGFICGLLFVFASLLLATNVNAQTVPVFNQDGNCIFLLNFVGGTNQQAFSQQERNSVTEAAQYWVDTIKAKGTMPIDPVTGNPQPVVIRIAKVNMANNAYAQSSGYVMPENASPLDMNNKITQSQALLGDGFCNEELSVPYEVDEYGNYTVGNGYHAFVGVGTGWTAAKEAKDVSGRVAQDLAPVIIHELGHALGIDNDYTVTTNPDTGLTEYAFSSPLTRWGARLRDANGKKSEPGMLIQHPDEYAINHPDESQEYFDVGSTHGLHEPNEEVPSPTFVGKNVLELWYGKPLDQLTEQERKFGVPIEQLSEFPYAAPGQWDWDNGMSHIDVTNGLMSHQPYRNYNGFIEIEMAALQDLGYTIERRDFFGKSYYQNGDGHIDETTGKWNYGTQVRNTYGLSKWNYGTGSYASTPNQSDFAIGAHLFASNLNILQLGNIYADGAGSAGIRIDGQNNQVTVDKNTVIKTNGVNGVGVLAAYGSGHNIIHQGYIEASGRGGKGISIDFGLPMLGDVRGSYYVPIEQGYTMNSNGGYTITYTPQVYSELNGPLVNNLDITGTIIGDKVHSQATYGNADLMGRYWQQTKEFNLGAAVYIDQTAHLANLNIMNGANIDGDIISYWTGTDGYGNYINQAGQWTAPNGYRNVSATNAGEMNQYPGNGNILNDNAWNDIAYRTSDKQTNLTFGLKAAEDGSATSQVDPNFHIVYNGNINYFRYELFPNIVTDWNEAAGTYIPVSPSVDGLQAGGDDTFWRFLTWDDGFFFSDDKFFTIERDLSNNKVYAGVVTPGLIDLRFAAGTTELVGSKVYVRNAAVDAGATLLLTPDPEQKYSIGTYPNLYDDAYDRIVFDEHNGEPEIHVGTSWDNSVYTSIWNWKTGINDPQYAYNPLELAVQKSLRSFTNNGRIAGNGSFYVGGITYNEINISDYQDNELWSPMYNVTPVNYIGTFINNGVISPGANNGQDVGKISIFGDLRLNSTSVYELTLNRTMLTDKDGHPVDANGNYLQANKASVYVENNDLISVSGETRLGGTLKVDVTPGSVFNKAVNNYTIIESGTFTAGTQFNSIITDVAFLSFMPGLTFVQQRDSVLGQLTVIRDMDYFKKMARTRNEIAVAQALDSSLNFGSALGFSLGYQNNKEADIRDIYNQLGASIRANSIMMNLWNPAEMVFNHIGYGNGQMETGGRGGINWKRIQERRAKMLGQCPVPNRAGSMWGNYFHTAFEAAGDGNSAAYNFDRNGFIASGEMNLTAYSSLGFNIAYSNNVLHQGGDKADSDDYQLGVYLVASPWNEFEIKSYLGLGIQEYDIKRRVYNPRIIAASGTGINEQYRSNANGNTVNYSLELARPIALHPAFILRPTLGLDVQYITQGHFSDKEDPNGTNLYRLNYNGTNLDRTLLRAGFSTETSGSRGGLRLKTFYVSNVGGDLYPVSKASFSAGSDPFVIWGTQLGKNYLDLGISGNLYLDGQKSSSFFFDYDANIYNTQRKIYNHSFNIGFIQNF